MEITNIDAHIADGSCIEKKVREFLVNFDSITSDIEKTENNFRILLTGKNHEELTNILKNALCEYLQIENTSLTSLDINETFEMWLDLKIKNATVSLMQNALALCGIEDKNNDKETLICNLIRRGISPHLSKNHLTILRDLEDSKNAEDILATHTLRAIYKSRVIAKATILEKENSAEAFMDINKEEVLNLSLE